MKRFFIFLVFLAVVAGIGYLWWQKNSTRIITAQVRTIAGSFFVNPENLSVENSAITIKGLREAAVSKLVISGNNLILRDGPTLSYAKLILNDVTIAWPPFHLSGVGKGAYLVKVSDVAVTKYLQKRGGNLAGVNLIPLNRVSVKFLSSSTDGTQVNVTVVDPLFKKQIPLTATGALVPSSSALSQVDFRVHALHFEGFSIGAGSMRKALAVINPVIDLSHWPVECDVNSIKTGKDSAVVQGKITGVSSSLLP